MTGEGWEGGDNTAGDDTRTRTLSVLDTCFGYLLNLSTEIIIQNMYVNVTHWGKWYHFILQFIILFINMYLWLWKTFESKKNFQVGELPALKISLRWSLESDTWRPLIDFILFMPLSRYSCQSPCFLPVEFLYCCMQYRTNTWSSDTRQPVVVDTIHESTACLEQTRSEPYHIAGYRCCHYSLVCNKDSPELCQHVAFCF